MDTTVGDQRLNVFKEAARIWGGLLPSNVDIARSGCGMSPTTLPSWFATPAISPRDPFGFSL